MFEIGKGGLEPPTSRTMRPPLFHLSYIPLCFSDQPPVNRISNNLFPWDLPEEYPLELPACGIAPPAQAIRTGIPCFSWQIAGDGFEPPFSRIWALRDSTSLSCLNPDSRVSKVFYVLCLNTRRFGLRQHRLYGRAPLHELNSTV